MGSSYITSGYSSSESTSSSRSTSDISVDATAHCKDRQKERAVSHKEIQRTLKHGLRTRDPGGNKQRQKCEFEGIVLIVAGCKRVVTAWRAAPKNIIVSPLPARLKTMLPKHRFRSGTQMWAKFSCFAHFAQYYRRRRGRVRVGPKLLRWKGSQRRSI
jgi:hypothetical protein